MNLFEKLEAIYNEPPKKDFDYNMHQTVRVLYSLEFDTYHIKDLLGATGQVVDRYTTDLHKDNKYEVQFPNGRIETFDETELDRRYCKRVNVI